MEYDSDSPPPEIKCLESPPEREDVVLEWDKTSREYLDQITYSRYSLHLMIVICLM